mgnify:CR=1 FL=1
MKRFLFLLVASLALCVGQADAQRCLPKMRGVELKAGMADGFYSHSNRDDAGYCFGAALATYTKGGDKWVFGGEYLQTLARVSKILKKSTNRNRLLDLATRDEIEALFAAGAGAA